MANTEIRHTFTPTLTLAEQSDGTYRMTVDFIDSWSNSYTTADGEHDLSMYDEAVTAACNALDEHLKRHPLLAGPVTIPAAKEVVLDAEEEFDARLRAMSD